MGESNEINPMIIEIIKMVNEGMSDSEIAAVIGRHKQAIYNYRRKYGIKPGSHYRLKAKPLKRAAIKKAVPQFKPLNQLCL